MNAAVATPKPQSGEGEATEKPGKHSSRGLLGRQASRGVGLALAVVLLLLVMSASILLGTIKVEVSDVIAAVSGPTATDVERVVRHIRIPRTVAGLLAGAALGVAGAVMQASRATRWRAQGCWASTPGRPWRWCWR